MNNTEFENLIRKTLHTTETPSRESFTRLIKTLDESTVTKTFSMRYTIRRVSNIINQTIKEFTMAWKTKNIILVPTFLLLIVIGAFSLSNRKPYDEVIMDLAVENQLIEDESIMDEELLVTDLNSPEMDELITQQNDIF